MQDELAGGAGADARRRRLNANDAARLSAHRNGTEPTYYEEDEVRCVSGPTYNSGRGPLCCCVLYTQVFAWEVKTSGAAQRGALQGLSSGRRQN